MKFSAVCQLLLASVAVAGPSSKAPVQITAEQMASFEMAALKARSAGLTDADILNFALTLEHLEKAFYDEGLATFSQADFDAVGYSPRLRFNIGEIDFDETTHVTFLQDALAAGNYDAVPACSYDFGLTDVKSFINVAGILEGVGVTAYLGAAHLISNPAYLTAAGSILTVEARHSAYIRDSHLPIQSGFAYPFDVPQDPMSVFSLASQFITSCPPAADLGITAFPLLSVKPGQNTPIRKGMWVVLELGKGAKAVDGTTYAYYTGNGGYIPADLTIPARSRGKRARVKTPAGVAGQSYVVLANEADPTMVSDSNIIAGPAIVMIQPPYTYGGFPQ